MNWPVLLIAVCAAAPLAGGQSAVAARSAVAANATTPGAVELRPTLICLGVVWRIKGDANENCRVEVAYRKKGSARWRGALDLVRVENRVHGVPDFPDDPITSPRGRSRDRPQPWEHRVDAPQVHYGNLLAGSIFDLEPDTDYDVKLTLSDPDGGTGERVLTARTRREPRAAPDGRIIHVAPGEPLRWFERTTTSSTDVPFTDLEAAEYHARPGDVILLHEGTYPGFRIRKRGTPERPIVWRGVDRDTVVIRSGINAEWARHVILEQLTIRDDETCIRADSSKGLAVRGCRLETKLHGIVAVGYEPPGDLYIADNVITGARQWSDPRGPRYEERFEMDMGGEGVIFTGAGHVVAHNRISGFGDCLSHVAWGPNTCTDIDIYGNDFSIATDDGVEMDYGQRNIRVFRNRFVRCKTYAVSTQPLYGGPGYIVRNAIVESGSFKLFWWSSGLRILHNTIVGRGLPRGGFRNAVLRNNIFAPTEGPCLNGTATVNADFDYNGYLRGDAEGQLLRVAMRARDGRQYSGACDSLQEFRDQLGMEQHGVELAWGDFARAPALGDESSFEGFDCTLKPDGRAVDAGAALPNINDDFTGDAPDLGCYEVGRPIPQYGPRPWVATKRNEGDGR